MSKLSQMAVINKVLGRQLALEEINIGCDFETTALKALKSLACPKEWAQALHVSHQLIDQWKNGEKKIPKERQAQIIHQAKLMLLELHEFEDEVDRLIFGR